VQATLRRGLDRSTGAAVGKYGPGKADVFYDGMWRGAVIARKAEDIKLAGKAILLNRHRAQRPSPPVRARWMGTSINPKRIAFQSLKKLGIDVRRLNWTPFVGPRVVEFKV
jgi:hypothetical protein